MWHFWKSDISKNSYKKTPKRYQKEIVKDIEKDIEKNNIEWEKSSLL